jgi:hypothetical protein
MVSLGVFVPMGTPGAYTSSQIQNQFSLGVFTASNIAIASVAGGITGLIGIMFRQGIYAIYAVLVFILGIFLGIGNWVFYGVGSLANLLLAGTGLEPIAGILQVLTVAFFFFFLASILAQRPDLT